MKTMEIYNPFDRCPVCGGKKLNLTVDREVVCTICGSSMGFIYPEVNLGSLLRNELLSTDVKLNGALDQISRVCEILNLPSQVVEEAREIAKKLLSRGARVRKEGLTIFSVLVASRKHNAIRRLDEIILALKRLGYEVPRSILRILSKLVLYYGKPLLIPSPILYARQITSKMASDKVIDVKYAERLFRKSIELASGDLIRTPSALLKASLAILLADLSLGKKLTPHILSRYSGYSVKTISKHIKALLKEDKTGLISLKMSELEPSAIQRRLDHG